MIKIAGPEKLAELLTMHSQEVDSVETKNGDFEFEVKILPNRAYDYINYFGVIRDISAILNLEAKISLPNLKKEKSSLLKKAILKNSGGANSRERNIGNIKTTGHGSCQKEDVFPLAPSERPDLKIKEDIIQEVARIYGYDKIKEKIPRVCLFRPKETILISLLP